jgi:hypothetical protein
MRANVPRLLLIAGAILFLSTSCVQENNMAPVPDSIITEIATSEPSASLPTFSPEPTASSTPQIQVQSTIKVTATAIIEPEPTASNTPVPSITPEPTLEPYADLFIENLAQRTYGGGEVEIVETLSSNDSFTRYLITYPSDGLTIYGFMNVPNEGQKFPVAIVVHGYIPPSEYDTLTYSTRYADSLAEAGYFVIHPNLRNHPPSDSGVDPFRVGYATDILNLIAVIREQSRDPDGYIRRADSDDINLWGHSMGGGIVLRTVTVNTEPYIQAAVLYASMSGDEIANFEKILEWSNGNEADLCQRLQELKHSPECFTYEGLPHTFRGSGDSLFMQRVVDFFNRQ